MSVKILKITEREYDTLNRLATTEQNPAFAFGIFGNGLEMTAANQWAVDLVRGWREARKGMPICKPALKTGKCERCGKSVAAMRASGQPCAAVEDGQRWEAA